MNAQFAHDVPTVDFIPQSYRELLLGCGASRERKVFQENGKTPFRNLTTLDLEASHKPDVVHDLNVTPWPFEDSSFDEVHAYEILEHLGRQGDAHSFFAHFSEIWRVLKPGGRLFASCPMWDSPWAWGDPGHTRIITKYTLVFLTQEHYKREVGVTASSDYRGVYTADFDIVATQESRDVFAFVLEAKK